MDYLVSVIVPIYNGENVINSCLQSLINQTMPFNNIEVILINDSSTDNSIRILNEFAEKYSNLKIISLTKNSGSPSTPRNIGISQATSEYIMFLDMDDEYTNDMCETLYNKIKKENVDFISCLYKIFMNKKQLNNPFNNLNNLGSEIKINNIFEMPEIIETQNVHSVMVWNKIYKKSFLNKYKIHFPPNYLFEDKFFNIQCYLNGKFILLNNYVGYKHYENNSSTSHSSKKNNLIRLLLGMEEIDNYLKKKNFPCTKINSNNILFWTILFLNNDLNISNQKIILKKSKHLYNNIKWNTIYGSNYPKYILILKNIFLIIFSSHYLIGIIISKIYKFFKLQKIYYKIIYSN